MTDLSYSVYAVAMEVTTEFKLAFGEENVIG
jgi:hypothetical protein